MEQLLQHPLILFLGCFAIMTLGSMLSIFVLRSKKTLDSDVLEDFGIVQGATLTLLALLIGFTFSMAVSRYDLRKNYEEEEANAIGTEYLRADLLTVQRADLVRDLLKSYLQARIDHYQTRDRELLRLNDIKTSRLETLLWHAVRDEAHENPTPVAALVVAGMNDVINTQGYTQAAWWNRIPVAAWCLLVILALFCCVLVGYSARSRVGKNMFLLILPAMVSLSLAMIADIDSPRGGLIRVVPQNLISLQQSLTNP